MIEKREGYRALRCRNVRLGVSVQRKGGCWVSLDLHRMRPNNLIQFAVMGWVFSLFWPRI